MKKIAKESEEKIFNNKNQLNFLENELIKKNNLIQENFEKWENSKNKQNILKFKILKLLKIKTVSFKKELINVKKSTLIDLKNFEKYYFKALKEKMVYDIRKNESLN